MTARDFSYIMYLSTNFDMEKGIIDMETMHTVTLTICGTDYVVTTDETPGYMQELAAQLDTRIRNVMNSNERISMVMATVITALEQADEAKKALQSADNLRKQLKTFFDDNNRTRMESESLRREIAQLRREKEELERKLAMR